VLEIGEGEVIFRGGELDVTLLVDEEQLAAVDMRAAPGWGKAPPHVHARHGEALYVLEGQIALQLEDRVLEVPPDSWAFIPPEVVHAVEVTGDAPARLLIFHTPSSGYGDYVRGEPAGFDQRPAADAVSADPGLVVVRRAGGAEGDTITNRPGRRATVLVETDEIIVSEFHYGAGEHGAEPHVHHEHADGFLVVDGEFTFHLRDGSRAIPAGTLLFLPPDVIHGFDNASSADARAFNFHAPTSGFGEYLRGRNPDFDQFDPPEDGAEPRAASAVRFSE
jgi:quercetin dioxygenase-like cupin family protein